MENVVITDVTNIEKAAQQPEDTVADVLDTVVDVESAEEFYIGALSLNASGSEEEDEELVEESEQ